MTRTYIVGGMFGLPELAGNAFSSPPFINEKSLFLLNARSGLSLLSELLSPPKVWVPSYLCHTILDGLKAAGATIDFFEIDYNFGIASYDWIQSVGSRDLVVFLDYFGWPFQCEYLDVLKKRGAWILEDASQAMLSDDIGNRSDFTLISPRKWLGIPDGGVLTLNNNRVDLSDIVLSNPPEEWWLRAFNASVLRRMFDSTGRTNRWFEVYKNVDNTHPIGRYAMSQLSKTLLTRCFDYQLIAWKRRENYNVLGHYLAAMAVFPKIPDGVVPIGFPIRCRNRNRLRQALIRKRVYPPIHWIIEDVVPDRFTESHKLSTEILTLPCDQRYGKADMARVANAVLGEIKA